MKKFYIPVLSLILFFLAFSIFTRNFIQEKQLVYAQACQDGDDICSSSCNVANDSDCFLINWPVSNPDTNTIFQLNSNYGQTITDGNHYWYRPDINQNTYIEGSLFAGETCSGECLPFPDSLDGNSVFPRNSALAQTSIKDSSWWYRPDVSGDWIASGKIFAGEENHSWCPFPSSIDTLTVFPYPTANSTTLGQILTKNNHFWFRENTNGPWTHCGENIQEWGEETLGSHTAFWRNEELIEIFTKEGESRLYKNRLPSLLESSLLPSFSIPFPLPNPVFSADKRYGIALGTWDYNKVQCYSHWGNRFNCEKAATHYQPNFSDMWLASYDNNQDQLNRNAFNVASFNVLDPNANIQFIWFHYEETDNPEVITSGEYDYFDPAKYTTENLGRPMTDDELTFKIVDGKKIGAEIYATSGAPGAVRVKVQKEPGTNIHDRGFDWRIRLPEMVYKDGYPFCQGCIFNETAFFDFLDKNLDFNDGDDNWYAFYLLAETEYGIISHYLEPYEYAAVFNEYVEKIKARYPKARFILQSPVAPFKNRYEPYFNDLYNPNLKLLTPQSKTAITYNSADLFMAPPPGPDFPYNGYPAVTDSQLQDIAEEFIGIAETIGNFFFSLNGKKTILTQTGVFNYGPVDPPPNSLIFGGSVCPWCSNNNDVWQTTEYGTARLIQLAFSQLEQKTNIAAWTYWGNVKQPNWVDPLINKTWGDLNHGIYWLSWPILCNNSNGCPMETNQPWPSRPGMVYLKLANGNKDYIPSEAPNWWPIPEDITGDGNVNFEDVLALLFSWLTPGSSLYDQREDINSDSRVNGIDFGHIIKNWRL